MQQARYFPQASSHTWYMELAGPIHPLSFQAHTYITMAYNSSLKWMQTYPLSANYQDDIITFLEYGIRRRFGTPKELYSSSCLRSRLVNKNMSVFLAFARINPKILSSQATSNNYLVTNIAIIACVLKTLIRNHARASLVHESSIRKMGILVMEIWVLIPQTSPDMYYHTLNILMKYLCFSHYIASFLHSQ